MNKITLLLIYLFSANIVGAQSVTMLPVSYDTCANAIDINAMFGGPLQVEMVTGPYDNTNATTDPTDPLTGWSCFGEPNGTGSAPELNNTLWFTFTGDGGYYYVESGTCAGVTNYIDGGDTQFALYTGSCGSLTPVKCSEDGPNSTSSTFPAGFPFLTTLGTTYYLLVDGFSFVGNVATGEFCIKVTHLPIIPCNDPVIDSGTTTQNKTTFCFMEGDTFRVDVLGAIAPNVGDFSGISMVLSTAPLTYADPTADPASYYFFGYGNPVPATFTRYIYNTGSIITSPGTWYFTPILFGNATANIAQPKYLNDFSLDTNCITFGTPAIFNVLPQSDPFCTIGLFENISFKNGGLHVYPSPANDELNIDFIANNEATANLIITDYIGRTVLTEKITTVEGINSSSSNVKHLVSGLYIVNISDSSGIRSIRFVKD